MLPSVHFTAPDAENNEAERLTELKLHGELKGYSASRVR